MLKVIITTWSKAQIQRLAHYQNSVVNCICHHPPQISTLVEFRVIIIYHRRKDIVRSKSESMASGWGITGNKGRCYDFWMDFSECMSRCREPKDCSLLREDYLECLHHSKEVQSNRIESPPSLCLYFESVFAHWIE